MEFRSRIISKFTFLFGDGSNEESEDGGEYNEATQFGKQWGWYSSIYALAQGDFTKFNDITNFKLTECLTYLTFEKQKQEIEQRQLKKYRK